MGILTKLLEERQQTTEAISPIVEEVTRAYNEADELQPVLEAVLQIAYEDYVGRVRSEEQLKSILQEIADYIITAFALYEAETKQQHPQQNVHHAHKHIPVQTDQPSFTGELINTAKEHPYLTGAGAGLAGVATAYGLYRLGKKVYEKIKNRK